MPIPCPPAVSIEVKLQRWQDLQTSKYHMQICIGATANIDKNLFIFKQLLDRDPVTGCFNTVFEAVATLQALADFKVDVPNEGQVFCRKNCVALVFDSIPAAQETERLILSDLDALVADVKASLSTFQSDSVVMIPGV